MKLTKRRIKEFQEAVDRAFKCIKDYNKTHPVFCVVCNQDLTNKNLYSGIREGKYNFWCETCYETLESKERLPQ